ncbi:TraB/GumN family protein [Marinomonas pollencensis]|uniref:TraB family protein n=1 Tax=Marinomonas pollencensis TaxID=491954 RepID=A0A3E0DST4_9GAMM|nr:TraB/GumN family protein [Marinomonas pollencensis]REG86593.1 hypothetical protein DFP81_101158 [Marinomonas pollencensis]
MSFIKKCGLTLFAAAAFQSQAASVWKVASGNQTLFLGGTIHILSPDDYPLPAAYDQAYNASDKVVFETDISAINSREFQQKLINQLSYRDGTTIDQVLQPETYQALTHFLEARHIPFSKIAPLKPSLIAMTLSVMELQSLGFTSEGVDQYYAAKATIDHKPQGWLEAPQDQIDVLESLGEGDENEMMAYSLQDIEDMPNTVDTLRQSWRDGNMVAMAEATITEFKQDYPDIYQALLVERNNLWMPQIETMLKDDSTEFIMVGAMHLAGPDGILARLAARGYQIEKL